MSRIAYLGPPGTFTEQATRALTVDFSVELVPFESVGAALAAVRSQQVLAAGIPIENSVEGPVPASMDALIAGPPLIAVSETVLPIRFDLFVRRGTRFDDVHTVASHPIALAQVRQWLADRLPHADSTVASSTAAAASAVETGEVDAAIASPVAREQFSGLVALATGIADVPDATTRFLLVQAPGAIPEPTGADRTSVSVVIDDQVGALAGLLTELSLRGINLSRIESRPTKDRLGEYRFFLDFDGHVRDARVGDALAGLRRRCNDIAFLGSYPKADRTPSSVRPSASEQAFESAARWLGQIRSGKFSNDR